MQEGKTYDQGRARLSNLNCTKISRVPFFFFLAILSET